MRCVPFLYRVWLSCRTGVAVVGWLRVLIVGCPVLGVRCLRVIGDVCVNDCERTQIAWCCVTRG